VLTLEGEEFPITGGVQGADGPGNSFVWAFAEGRHHGRRRLRPCLFGVPREARQNWMTTIDRIAALKP
jgi:hypothetical protein